MLETIILTEDDADDVMFFKYALEKFEYKFAPWIAKSCDELFTILDEMIKIPEIIFLDLNMPCINGFICLTKIRKISLLDTCKIVMLTTSRALENVERARLLGADYFVTKPSEINDLTFILKAIISKENIPTEFVQQLKKN